MSNQRTFRWTSGRLVSTSISRFWTVGATEDPSIPNLPLESPPATPSTFVDVSALCYTVPQQSYAQAAGLGIVFVASAILSSFTPPLHAAEYQYGTHRASALDQGIRGSTTFKYPHAGLVVQVQPGKFIATFPQVVPAPPATVFPTAVAQLIKPPNRPKTWTGPQQYGVDQGRFDRTDVQFLTPPPNRPDYWTLPQPYEAQQGSVYHTLIQQFIAPPNRPRTWTDPQPYGVDQGQFYKTFLTSEIPEPTLIHAASWTLPQSFGVQQGQFYRTVIQQFIAPPIRNAITTVAEVPRNVPSSVKGDVAKFVPPQKPLLRTISTQAEVPRNAPSAVFHTLIQQFIAPPKRPYITTQAEPRRYLPSSFKITTPWLPSTLPPTSYPPVNPRYQYGTHQLHHLQSSNRISMVLPWQIQLYEAYFISLDTIGERDEDFELRPSTVFMPQIAEGAPYVEPKDRPVVVQVRPQPYENQQGQIYTVHLDARVETLAIRDQANFTLPQTYQVRNDSKVFVHPPRTVTSPRKYRSIETVPQPTQLYDINRSKVSARNAAQLPSVPVTDVYEDLVGMEINIYQGIVLPEVIRHMGRVVTEPKLIGAIAQLEPPFDFSRGLEAGETLLTASVIATVYSGVDPNPSAIRSGSPVINGNKVEQMMKGGVLGCVYELLCTASTSMGQTLQLSTYFYVEPNLP